MFRTVPGVDSAAPGFGRAIVKPHLGKLTKVLGTVSHSAGSLEVDLQPAGAGAGWSVSIGLPAGITGHDRSLASSVPCVLKLTAPRHFR
jgi:alpha-L-rhamnosidase